MKRYVFFFIFWTLSLPFCVTANSQDEATAAHISQMQHEIERLEEICAPMPGTPRKVVEDKFGTGQPALNAKITGRRVIPETSPYRSYTFCHDGTLFVCYDKQWKVWWAAFVDPYSTKGRVGGIEVPLTEQLHEVKPRLAQMQRIYDEYRRRFQIGGKIDEKPQTPYHPHQSETASSPGKHISGKPTVSKLPPVRRSGQLRREPLTVESAYHVVPGHSVGPVALGMSRAAVRKLLGKPQHTELWRSGRLQDVWLGSVPQKNQFGSTERRHFLAVTYRNRRVVQIGYNSPRYLTQEGIRVGSSLTDFRSLHPHLRLKQLGYTEYRKGQAVGGWVMNDYDDVRHGLCFSFAVQNDWVGAAKSHQLRIHVAGHAVLPDSGGEPLKAYQYRPREDNRMGE